MTYDVMDDIGPLLKLYRELEEQRKAPDPIVRTQRMVVEFVHDLFPVEKCDTCRTYNEHQDHVAYLIEESA